MDSFKISLIFAFLAMIFWGVGDFLIQKTIKKIGEFQTLLFINLFAGLALIPFVLKDFPLIFDWPNILLLIIMTIIDLLYSIFLFKAYNKGKLSVIEIALIGELPLTIFLGLIFFGEKLSFIETFLVLLIILGVFLISKSKKNWKEKIKEYFLGRKFVWEKGILFVFVAIIFSSFYNLLVAFNARTISAFTSIWFPWTLSSIFLLIYIIYKKGLKSSCKNIINYKKLIFFTALIDTAAWIFYALATQKEELSIITAIVAGYAVIAMILDIKINKQKIGNWQYLGAFFVFVGVIVISFIAK